MSKENITVRKLILPFFDIFGQLGWTDFVLLVGSKFKFKTQVKFEQIFGFKLLLMGIFRQP